MSTKIIISSTMYPQRLLIQMFIIITFAAATFIMTGKFYQFFFCQFSICQYFIMWQIFQISHLKKKDFNYFFSFYFSYGWRMRILNMYFFSLSISERKRWRKKNHFFSVMNFSIFAWIWNENGILLRIGKKSKLFLNQKFFSFLAS